MSPLNRSTVAQHLSTHKAIRQVEFVDGVYDPDVAYVQGVYGGVYVHGKRRGCVVLSVKGISDASWDDMASHELLYWSFLHECGHLLSAGQPSDNDTFSEATLVAEYDAWHWAVWHSAIPVTDTAITFMTDCLATYERYFRKFVSRSDVVDAAKRGLLAALHSHVPSATH